MTTMNMRPLTHRFAAVILGGCVVVSASGFSSAQCNSNPPGSAGQGFGSGVPGMPNPQGGIPTGFDPFGPDSPFTSRGSSGSFGEASWTTWWHLHEELFLDLAIHVRATPMRSGSDGYFLGRGRVGGAPDLIAIPSVADVTDQILPALLRALDDDPAEEVEYAALLAVARAGRRAEDTARAAVLRLIEARIDSPRSSLADAAVLALGLLGERQSLPLLCSLLHDDAIARARIGHAEVPRRMRAHAAFSIALAAEGSSMEDVRRYAAHHLLRALDDGGSEGPDLAIASALALARLPFVDDGGDPLAQATPPSSTSLEAVVQRMQRAATDPSRERLVRAQAFAAMGGILKALPATRREAFAALLAPDWCARVRESGNPGLEERAGLVFALGSVGDDDPKGIDALVRSALLGVAEDDADSLVRGLALIGLAETSARAGSSGDSTSALGSTTDRLILALRSGSASLRPWAALASGVLGARLRGRDSSPPPALIEAVRSRFEVRASPAERSALALALGLLGDLDSYEPLSEDLAEFSEAVASYEALALGFLGDPRAIELLRSLRVQHEERVAFVESASLALAVLEDPAAGPTLMDLAQRARIEERRSAFLRILGRVGDRRALPTLIEAAERNSVVSSPRAAACQALGRLADSQLTPWPANSVPATNWLISTDWLLTRSGRGILDPLWTGAL